MAHLLIVDRVDEEAARPLVEAEGTRPGVNREPASTCAPGGPQAFALALTYVLLREREYFFHLFLSYFPWNLGIFLEISPTGNGRNGLV